MQEGILSLMQMPKATVAIAELKEPACPISSCCRSDHGRRHRLLPMLGTSSSPTGALIAFAARG